MATSEPSKEPKSIKQENFKTSWDMSWKDSHSNKDQDRYVYVCAPVWYISVRAIYAAFGGSGIVQLRMRYWNNTSWSSEVVTEINGSSGSKTWYYGHNRDEGNISNNGIQHSDYPLWSFRYWPSRGNSNWNITFYVGGWGVANRTSTGESINYPQGKHIQSRGRTATFSGSGTSNQYGMYYTYTANMDTKIMTGENLFNREARRGSHILESDDSELVYYPY